MSCVQLFRGSGLDRGSPQSWKGVISGLDKKGVTSELDRGQIRAGQGSNQSWKRGHIRAEQGSNQSWTGGQIRAGQGVKSELDRLSNQSWTGVTSERNRGHI
ncbi:hypothetical protein BgiMline_016224 [Biomphalaria glabrata]|nr:hypothetical protein BgiMline_009026 [Biomphalaria glabrata]